LTAQSARLDGIHGQPTQRIGCFHQSLLRILEIRIRLDHSQFVRCSVSAAASMDAAVGPGPGGESRDLAAYSRRDGIRFDVEEDQRVGE
jgi:hypothetical protein